MADFNDVMSALESMLCGAWWCMLLSTCLAACICGVCAVVNKEYPCLVKSICCLISCILSPGNLKSAVDSGVDSGDGEEENGNEGRFPTFFAGAVGTCW